MKNLIFILIMFLSAIIYADESDPLSIWSYYPESEIINSDGIQLAQRVDYICCLQCQILCNEDLISTFNAFIEIDGVLDKYFNEIICLMDENEELYSVIEQVSEIKTE